MEKRTINEQLNIPLLKNAGAETLYMPQLFNEELDSTMGYDYQIVKGGVSSTNSGFSSADGNNGWNNCAGGCGSFSNAIGDASTYRALIYPTCFGNRKVPCQECKTECKDTKKLPWRNGGKECFKTCFDSKLAVLATTAVDSTGNPIVDLITPSGTSGGRTVTPTPTSSNTATTGMSTGAKIGIGVGAVALVGFGIWFFGFRKKG
mgnify:CR=1 FL=1